MFVNTHGVPKTDGSLLAEESHGNWQKIPFSGGQSPPCLPLPAHTHFAPSVRPFFL